MMSHNYVAAIVIFVMNACNLKHVGETNNLVIWDTPQIQLTYLYKQTTEVLKSITNALLILNTKQLKNMLVKQIIWWYGTHYKYSQYICTDKLQR